MESFEVVGTYALFQKDLLRSSKGSETGRKQGQVGVWLVFSWGNSAATSILQSCALEPVVFLNRQINPFYIQLLKY